MKTNHDVCQVSGCGIDTNLIRNSSYTRKDGTVVNYYMCRQHKNERQLAYYKTPRGRLIMLENNKRYYANRKLH